VTPGLHDQERTLLWDDGRKAVALEGLLGPKPPEVGGQGADNVTPLGRLSWAKTVSGGLGR
jgi:hypothetical protein